MAEIANPALNEEASLSEGSFDHWKSLPPELKVQVLRKLPYETLRNFMFLSKECLSLASKTDVNAFAVFLDVGKTIFTQEAAAIGVWFWRNEKKYEILFVEDGQGGCFVRRKSEEELRRNFEIFSEDEEGGVPFRRVNDDEGKRLCEANGRYESTSGVVAATRTFFQIIRNIRANEMQIEVKSSDKEFERVLSEQPTTLLFKCDEFIVFTESCAILRSLFRFLVNGCCLQIHERPYPGFGKIFVESACFDLKVMREAPSIHVFGSVGVTDEQLQNLRAHDLRFKAPCVSSKGINGLILQWLRNQRRISCISLEETKELKTSEILAGVNPSVILSESELHSHSAIFFGNSDRLAFVTSRGPAAGILNASGSLVAISVLPNCCYIEFIDLS